jgi:hypothetical protein
MCPFEFLTKLPHKMLCKGGICVKKLFMIFAFIILMLALFKANIFEFEDVVSVEKTVRCTQDDIEWMLQVYSNGEVAIAPMGDLPTNVVVPTNIDGHTITKISDYAFSGYKNLKTVELPSPIQDVGNYAFWDCENLVSVVFEEKQIRIKENAFTGCSKKLIEKVNTTNPNIIWS